jgi:outer membrane protein assembly factor BamE (lipoprotein component of BamABCDE complex)
MRRALRLIAAIAPTVSLAVGVILARDATEYSPGFSEARFALIAPGMSEHTVRAFLGEPLGEESGPFPEAWEYPSQRVWRGLLTFEPAAIREIYFQDGRVLQARGIDLAGVAAPMSENEVLDRLGNPTEIRPSYARKVWYSRQKGEWGRISRRAICYDASGTVVAVNSSWDFD